MSWPSFTYPPDNRVNLDPGHLADHTALADDMKLLGGLAPSGDTSGVTDRANLMAAIAGTPAGTRLRLAPGIFYVNAPVIISKRIILEGADAGFGWNIYAAGYPGNSQFEAAAQTGTVIQAVAGWAQGAAPGAALLLLTTDATHYITEGPVIRNICLSGTTGTGVGGPAMSATADALSAIGAVANVQLDNVMCMYVKGWGISTVVDPSAPPGFTINYPGTWRVSRVCCYHCTAGGIIQHFTDDSVWTDVLCIGNGGPGWQITGNNNCSFNQCRAEWNGSHGFWLTGGWPFGAGQPGSIIFNGCSTDANAGNGVLIDATTGTATVSFNGLYLRRDSNVSGGGTAAGFAISQTASASLQFRVFIRGCMITATTAGFASTGPHYGLSLTGTGVWVDIDGSYLIGALQATLISGTPAYAHFGPGVSYFNGSSDAPVTDFSQPSSSPGDWSVGGTAYLGVTNVYGIAAFNAGTATPGSAPLLTPVFANGVASQLSDLTRDYMVYLQIGTAGTALAIAMGPTSAVANVIVTAAAAASGAVYAIRLPGGWYLKWSATTATMAHQAAVGC